MPEMHIQPARRTHLRGFAAVALAALLISVRPTPRPPRLRHSLCFASVRALFAKAPTD
jgi:hypothetical protein